MPIQVTVEFPEAKEKKNFQCFLNAENRNQMCSQCSYMIAPGRRCKQRSCVDHRLCWQHLRKEFKLRIAPSQLQIDGVSVGRGVFALTDKPLSTRLLARLKNGKASARERQQYLVFATDAEIAPYAGQTLTKKELDDLYDYKDHNDELVEQTGPYTVNDNVEGTIPDDGSIRDALCVRNVAAYVNDPHGSKDAKANVEMHFKVPDTGPLKKKRTAGIFIIKATRDIFQGEEILLNYGQDYWEGGPIAQVKEKSVRPRRA